LDEFRTLFAGRFRSQEELLREYECFLTILDQLDQAPVPELSAGQKADIFRRSWQGRPQERSWLVLLRRPAVAFAAGIILGCTLMFAVMNGRVELIQPASADQPLIVEHAGQTQTYRGAIIDGLYPQIENPKIVLERTDRSSPRRVLYGTLDDGEVYVVWNL
jgi:hypothetical protein